MGGFVSDSEFLRQLAERGYLDPAQRVWLRKIANKLVRLEEIERLTRVEMERLEKERGVG